MSWDLILFVILWYALGMWTSLINCVFDVIFLGASVEWNFGFGFVINQPTQTWLTKDQKWGSDMLVFKILTVGLDFALEAWG